MLHGDRPFGYRPDYHDRDHINIKRHRRETEHARYASGITQQTADVCPAALHRILRAGAVRARRVNPTKGQLLRYATHPGNDIIARQPRLASPACPSFHHAFQNKTCQPGPIVSTTVPGGVVGAHNQDMRPTTMVPCDVPRSAAGRQSGDMGRARTLHSSRDLLFGSSLLIAEGGNGSSKLSWPLAALEIGNLQCLLT